MKKKIIYIFLLLFIISCSGEREENQTSKEEAIEKQEVIQEIVQKEYYNSALGKNGEDLKSALNKIVTENHDKLTYKQAYDALEYTDEDPENSDNVILFYTGRSQEKSLRSQYDGKDGWNREHVWPKSKGFKGSRANYGYTDLHHLRPADASVNSSKSDKDLDNGGTPHKEAIGSRSDSDSWEPRDEIKGDTARMMFYMAVRYEGLGDKFDDYDLELVDYTGLEGSKEDFDGRYGKLSTLIEWHEGDPVDEWERIRHEKVYEIQKNRNPFIDNPQWVEEIWGQETGYKLN